MLPLHMIIQENIPSLQHVLERIVDNPSLHSRWINTLSFMENVGSRKISKFEHRTETNLTILKHAAEEARHAYFLKKQIGKIDSNLCPTFQKEFLLASQQSLDYLNVLDIEIARYLKKSYNLSGYPLKFGSYLLTTYAIEVRANDIYPVYQNLLDKMDSDINVKSIIQEEIGHLDEMEKDMVMFLSDPETDKKYAIQIETELYYNWIFHISKEIGISVSEHKTADVK